jgi:hypothetical protein
MSLFKTLALVFLGLWLVGFFGFYQAVSSFIHSLILLAIVFFVVDLLTSRRRFVR